MTKMTKTTKTKTQIEQTDDPTLILKDFIDRMRLIQKNVEGFEGRAEVFMSYSLQVQIESEITRLGLELSKIKILEFIADILQEKRGGIKNE